MIPFLKIPVESARRMWRGEYFRSHIPLTKEQVDENFKKCLRPFPSYELMLFIQKHEYFR